MDRSSLLTRKDFLAELTSAILALTDQPLCVAITGIGTSGKTTLADEIAVRLRRAGRRVERASIDDVYLPGRLRPESSKPLHVQFVEDGVIDLELFRRSWLDPCGPRGDRRIRRLEPLLSKNRIEIGPPELLSADTILLVDGVFLLHPSLRHAWGLSVWLDVDPSFCLEHGLARGQDNDVDCARRFGEVGEDPNEALRRLYERLFLPGHALFVERFDPVQAADWVVDHSTPSRPTVKRVGKG